MKRIGLIALFLALAATAATAAPTGARRVFRPSAQTCGGILWRLKTFSDPGRTRVNLVPRLTTIAKIRARPFPHPLPRTRRTRFQRQTWRVVAQVTEYRLDGNELRLVLFDDPVYMNAVIPVPACLSRATRERGSISNVWSMFSATCGHPRRTWQSHGAVVFVDGVGFWSSRFQARRGMAPNGAELHPVTGLRPIAGCGH
jgi:hypothetical protein